MRAQMGVHGSATGAASPTVGVSIEASERVVTSDGDASVTAGLSAGVIAASNGVGDEGSPPHAASERQTVIAREKRVDAMRAS